MAEPEPTARQVQALLRTGQVEPATALAERLLAAEPDNIFALSFLSGRALERGNADRAIRLGQRAIECQPDNPTLHKNLGMAFMARGRFDPALEAYLAALSRDPDQALTWLYLAEALAALGREREGGLAADRAFALDPELPNRATDPQAPPALRQLSAGAQALLKHVRRQGRTEAARSAVHPAALSDRFVEFLDGYCRVRPIPYGDPLQQPTYQYLPRLEAHGWWDPQRFDWVGRMEAAFAAVREELLAVLEAGAGMQPYVGDVGAVFEGAPEGWQRLEHSLDWSSYHLLKGGEVIEPHCQACPRTHALLDSLPLASAEGHAPEAFFSILKPGTVIPPHYGLSNSKLTVHLPLVVPPDCAIKVGGEARAWQEGRVMIFDDSYLHEAWNRSESTRAVLITEVWNPDLADDEQAALAAVIGWDTGFARASRSLSPESLHTPQ